jgi:hypothetical protein
MSLEESGRPIATDWVLTESFCKLSDVTWGKQCPSVSIGVDLVK